MGRLILFLVMDSILVCMLPFFYVMAIERVRHAVGLVLLLLRATVGAGKKKLVLFFLAGWILRFRLMNVTAINVD